MDVVWVIPEPVDAHRRIRVGKVFLINANRRFVVGERVEVAPDAIEDVARHVHEVAGARHAAQIAAAVARVAYDQGFVTGPTPANLLGYVTSQMYEPRYSSYV